MKKCRHRRFIVVWIHPPPHVWKRMEHLDLPDAVFDLMPEIPDIRLSVV